MKFFITLFTFSLLLVQTTSAQILDRTENRAKQKANNRVDQKIDKGLDKGLDAIEGLFGKKKKKSDDAGADNDSVENSEDSQSEASQSKMLSRMMGGDVNVEDSYTFNHNILLDIESFDKKGKSSGTNKMTMYFANESPNFGMSMDMEGTSNFIIYDMNTYEMVTLIDNDGQKMGMAMKLNPDKFIDEKDKPHNENVSFEKTGRSKEISGYSCEEYKLIDPESDPDTESTFWLTEETDANWIEMMSKIASTNKNMQKGYVIPEDYPKGSMIQIVNSSTKNQEKSIITVEKINQNQTKVIETGGYQMMSLPGGSH